MGQVIVLGGAAAAPCVSAGQPQYILLAVSSCACTSRPMVVRYSAMPCVSILPIGATARDPAGNSAHYIIPQDRRPRNRDEWSVVSGQWSVRRVVRGE